MTDTNQASRPAVNGPARPQPVATRPAVPPRSIDRSPEALEFLAHYENALEQSTELKLALNRAQSTIRGYEARIQTATDELKRVTRERNDYQARYQQIKAHLADAASILIEAVEERGHDK